jgi:hypothetical protein
MKSERRSRAAVVLLVAIGHGSAAAAPATEPELDAILEEKVIDAPAASVKSFNGCWALHGTAGRKALFGNTLYTYWQTTRVCARNGRVTSVNVYDAGGETSTPGWRIDKPPTRRPQNVGWEGRGIAEYHFVLGGPWDIQRPTDCIQLRLNADGRHYRSMGSCDPGAR